MKCTRVIRYLASLIAFSSAILTLAQNPAPRQQPQQPQQPIPLRSQPAGKGQVKTFAGKITKSNGKFILRDLSSTISYALDDQKRAGKYAGKVVLVTGVLDSDTNTIRIQKIDTAA